MNEKKNYQLKFEGDGKEYFGIVIINWLLTLVTLGLYYPWAKEKTTKYTYGVTSIDGNHFSFHGTGKEMFIGMLKFVGFIFVILILYLLFITIKLPIIGIIIYLGGIIAILPLAMHGTMRYRMSRTTLKGIRFGYRGDRKELTIMVVKKFLLTLVTLGIYGSWMAMHLQKYLVGNTRYGEVEGKFEGDGGEYFILNLKGYLLTLVTLGIYGFWWQADLISYITGKTSLHKGEDKITLSSTITGGSLFGLVIINMLITVCTLGLGFAWVQMRTMKFYADNIQIEGTIDLESLTQTEEEYNNAFGDGALDFFDMDLF